MPPPETSSVARWLAGEDWRARLRQAVSPLDHGVRPLSVAGYRPPGREAHRPARTAAVLVPILEGVSPQVILTLRAENLSAHGGQVSFPGGAAEPGDDSAVATALREAREEIALDPSRVTPVGFLDRYDTISDYRVLPVVGLVAAGTEVWPDDVEVTAVFGVPLEIALDPGRYQRREIERDGREYVIHSLNHGGHLIWGATAAILLNLARRLGVPGD
ncbi:MAG: CoA pyrophosphatase [Xanthomonadales bacterium]|nr:CoA pyrophosphatase [Xanthomonadales bacterium]